MRVLYLVSRSATYPNRNQRGIMASVWSRVCSLFSRIACQCDMSRRWCLIWEVYTFGRVTWSNYVAKRPWKLLQITRDTKRRPMNGRTDVLKGWLKDNVGHNGRQRERVLLQFYGDPTRGAATAGLCQSLRGRNSRPTAYTHLTYATVRIC